MEFEQMEQLLCIQKEKTLSRASSALNISQPALSRSMQRLEKELNVELFVRTRNRIELSETGKLAAEQFAGLLKHKEEVIQALQECYQQNRTVNICGCAPAVCYGIKAVLEKNSPHLQVNVSVLNDETQILDALEKGQIQGAVIPHKLHLKNMLCEYLTEENLYACLPADHPLAGKTEISFGDLNGQSILQYSNVGFWFERTKRNVPDSRLLIQTSRKSLSEISAASSLIRFKTNLSLQGKQNLSGRIAVPIADPDAKARFYLICPARDMQLFDGLNHFLETLDWSEVFAAME